MIDVMTMPDDQLAYNRNLIEQFRADGGASIGDRPLLLLTTVGRRSGTPRTSPLMYVRSQDRYLIIASNNGSTRPPQWYLNLEADPVVTVEVPGKVFTTRATPLTGAEYDREWAAIKAQHPFFVEHEQRAQRTIPVVALG
jgi:deazaflavin-dependent oxidoreductase (nitroreductase family)